MTKTKADNGTATAVAATSESPELDVSATGVAPGLPKPNPLDEARAVLIAEEQARRQRYIDGHQALVNETGYDHAAEPVIENGLIKVRFFVTKVKEPKQ